MKITTLSVLAALALSATSASALTLYTDPASGQVFTQAADGRIEMGDFVDAKTVYMENQAQDSAIAKKESKRKDAPVYAKASKLQFSGTHYLGYKYVKMDEENPADGTKIGTQDWSGFETRRNYLQVKAYFFDNPKSYMRVTLDTFQNNAKDMYTGTGDLQAEKQGGDATGSTLVRLKYAFIYLDNILPYTGVEFGQVHRPWIDYEEHNAMWYRSVSKVFIEAAESADLSNSADLGINFKTKTPYFSSEIGVFNGEGYHQQESGQGNSLEWRFTAALNGNGDIKRKPLQHTYFDVSTFGQHQEASNKVGTRDSGVIDGYGYRIYGLHTVYNQPSLLLSAQAVKSESDNDGSLVAGNENYKQGEGYSVNGTYRFGADYEYELFGRYDRWNDEKGANGSGVDNPLKKKYWLAGAAYQYNKNVKFLANMLDTSDNDSKSTDDYQTFMLTAEVNW